MGRAGAVRRVDEAHDLFDRIGRFLTEHRLSPDPAHYAFAHGVLSAPASMLAAEVERLTDGGVRLTRAAIEELGGQFVAGDGAVPRERTVSIVDQEQVQAQRLVTETQTQVDGFADLMRAMQDETRGFGQDLAQSAAAIVQAEPVRGTREIARIAGAMIERIRESEAKLARATEETEGLRAKLAEAQETARRDPLSGLANRLAFAEGFANRDSSAGPHCIALCDVDRFKRINDTHGHGVGDRVLKAIGRSLSEAFDDHLVARHGGEEFAVLVSGAGLAEATALLDDVRTAVAAKRFRDRETGAALGTVTFSGGVTVVQPGEDMDTVIARADRLLYAAKAGGRDRITAG